MIEEHCDLCGEVTDSRDMRLLSITDREEKPVVVAKDICVFCKDKLVGLLKTEWQI